jgi:hypothetical protein
MTRGGVLEGSESVTGPDWSLKNMSMAIWGTRSTLGSLRFRMT